jgi:cysteine desulfurase / selenocysteine lyase
LQILPIDGELEPSQIVANLPAPPKRPPPQPPSKEWIVGKLVAMSGQPFTREEKPAETSAASSGVYWLPSTSGIKHGEPATPAVRVQPGHFDVDTVRKDFPILKQKVNGKPLVWLDNAATTQKPQQVIDRISHFYETENSNVHRAAHELAARSTDAYEAAREKLRKFLGAATAEEIVFTRGTTESINLVAQSYGGRHLSEGDEIILTRMEHHSNIVPWQHIARATGARIRVAPFFDNGEIDLGAYERLFSRRTRIVSITHVSNALGSVLPVQEMIATAHRHGVVVLVDGAQSVPHFPVNVQGLDADFYALSGHKLFGPTGVGVLYGKAQLLEEMPPWQGGGNMIENVSFERTTYNPPPSKFEAGTAILAGAVGLGAAIDYLDRIGFANAARYEHGLLEYGQERLRRLKGVRMIGEAREKAGVMSFISDRVSPSEMGEVLNAEGIAVRTGHHCAQPALAHYGLQATIRPSLAFYNTRDEIDLLVATVKHAIESRS